jgi:anti-sigma B factor antagonist
MMETEIVDAERLEVLLLGEPPLMTIALRGELTSPDGDAVLDAYRRATAQGARSIVVDFAGVELMNSGGISQIVGILTETRKTRQRLLFAGLTPHYRKILTMMGLTRYAQVFDTAAEAYAAEKAGA